MNNEIKDFEAYPQDKYVAKKIRAARIKQTWMIVCIIAIIVSICVDVAQISDIMGQAVHSDELKYPLGISVAIIYVAVSGLSGHLFRMSKNDDGNKETNRNIGIFIILLVVAFLIVIMIARYYSLTNDHPELPLYNITTTIMFTIAMFMGAIASWILAYFWKQAIRDEILEQAKDNIPLDNQLYEDTKSKYKQKHFDNKKNNEEIKKIINGYTENIENCKYLYWQLLMIIEPGNAHGIIDKA